MTKLLLSELDFITVLMWQEDEMHKPNSYRENGSKKTSTDTQTDIQEILDQRST